MFLASIWSSFRLSSPMFRFIPPMLNGKFCPRGKDTTRLTLYEAQARETRHRSVTTCSTLAISLWVL